MQVIEVLYYQQLRWNHLQQVLQQVLQIILRIFRDKHVFQGKYIYVLLYENMNNNYNALPLIHMAIEMMFPKSQETVFYKKPLVLTIYASGQQWRNSVNRQNTLKKYTNKRLRVCRFVLSSQSSHLYDYTPWLLFFNGDFILQSKAFNTKS